MAGPYDSVVSIGGQSFVDGLWRIFGPALEGLTNPVPVAIPGFSNAQLRITQLIPIIPGPVDPAGALNVIALVEVTAEALLHVVTETGAVTIVGPANLQLPEIPSPAVVPVPVDLTPGGPLVVPAAVVLSIEGPSLATRFSLKFTITKVEIGQVTVDPGLANTLTADLQNRINQIVSQLGIAGVNQPAVDSNVVAGLVAPLGKIVSAAVDDALTGLIAQTGRIVYPTASKGASCDAEMLATGADAQLAVTGSGEYLLQVGLKRATNEGIPNYPSFSPADLVDCNVLIGNRFLLELICCVIERLPAFAIPARAVQATEDVLGEAHTLCFNFSDVVANFGSISVAKGRLSVCLDALRDQSKKLTLVGRFRDGVAVPNFPDIGTIKINFRLPLDFDVNSATSITNLRALAKPKITVRVSISGLFLFALVGLAVLVAAMLGAAVGGIIGGLGGLIGAVLGGAVGDIVGGLGGWIGDIFGGLGGWNSGLIGSAGANVLGGLGGLINDAVDGVGDFFGGLFGGFGALFGALLGGLIGGALLGGSIGLIAGIIIAVAVKVAAMAVRYLIDRAVRTLLSGASLFPSPVALPPGVLDAFGKFAPSLEVLDDLTCQGVLHTPTSPWALLSRIGRRRFVSPDVRPPKEERAAERGRPAPQGTHRKTSSTTRASKRAATKRA